MPPRKAAAPVNLVNNAGSLRAVADPLRIRMGLLLVDAPRTVKEMAAILKVPPTRLYYHVRLLEREGLIRVAKRRMVSGIEERTYETVGDGWTVSPDIDSADYRTLIGPLLAAVGAETECALDEHPDGPGGDPLSAVPACSLTDLFLTEAELREVERRLTKIVTDFGPDRGKKPRGGRQYHFLFAGYRVPGSSDAS